MYGAWYGFERTFIELLRTDSLMLGNSGIRVSSLLSALLCIACVTVLIVAYKRKNTKEQDKTYLPVFSDDVIEAATESAKQNTKTQMDVELDLSEE